MNAIKTYKIANKKKGMVEYGYVGSKWNFRAGKITLMYKVPGGLAVAKKIAEALHKSILRSGGVDGVFRNILNRLLKVRTLADWRPDRDWWSNDSDGQVSVPIVYINQQPAKGFGPEDLKTEPAASEVKTPESVEVVS